MAKRVEGVYASVERATVRFDQTYTNVTFGNATRSAGRLYVKPPGAMRWDYVERKLRRSFICDGTELWMVDLDNKQAARQPINQSTMPVAISFLTGNGKLSRDFHVALASPGTHARPGHHTLELTPKQPSTRFSTVWLVVDAGDFHVAESIVLEPSGNTNRLVFGALDTDKPVKDSWFRVNPETLRRSGFTITP